MMANSPCIPCKPPAYKGYRLLECPNLCYHKGKEPIMPRSSNPDKYPSAFNALIDHVVTKGELFIAHEHPSSFRGYLQSFLLAVEKTPSHPRHAIAPTLMVRKVEGGVIVCHRDHSKAALAVAAALKIDPGAQASIAELDFARRLASLTTP